MFIDRGLDTYVVPALIQRLCRKRGMLQISDTLFNGQTGKTGAMDLVTPEKVRQFDSFYNYYSKLQNLLPPEKLPSRGRLTRIPEPPWITFLQL